MRSAGGPWTLAATLLTVSLLAPAARAQGHPSLLFSAEDEPLLQQKLASGVRQTAYAAMCPWMWWEDGAVLPADGACLEELGFRYRMSGDASYADQARTMLGAMVATDPATLYDPNDVASFAGQPVPIAMAYDLLYAALDPAERQATVECLERYGDLLYAYLANGSRDALSSEVVAAYAGLGLLGLAIRNESSHPDLADWLETAATELGLNGFGDAWNPDGSFDEGYGGSLRGSPEALRFAEAYRRATGSDFVLGTHIARAPAWYAYGWLPHLGHPAFGEPTWLGGQALASEHLLTIGRTNDLLGKWAWHQLHGVSGIDVLQRPAPVSGLLGVALWYPDELPLITDPLSAGYPLDATFADTHNPDSSLTGVERGQGGLVAFRDGWISGSVALLLKVSDEWQARSHNDSSSLVLSAYGVEMAMDSPTASAARRSAHSVVLVSSHDDDAERRTRYRGALGTVFSSNWASYATADGRYPSGAHDAGDPALLSDDQWTPVERAERMVALVRGPRPYVIVADDVSADGLSAAPSRWLLQLGWNAYGLSGGSGEPSDPLRIDYYGGQQLLGWVVEPAGGYQALAGTAPDAPWNQRLSIDALAAVDTRFLVLLQPHRWVGDPEQPYVMRLAASGGTGADVYWSDGVDRLLVRHEAAVSVPDGTSTDARLLVVRQAWGATSSWLAGDATRALTAQGGLLDTGGLRVSAAMSGARLTLDSAEPPTARQIVAYAPGIAQVVLNGAPSSFARSGTYVLVPAECALEERCNRMDDDCDGAVDEDDAVDAPVWFKDEDGDGYGDSADTVRACAQPTGYAAAGGDCDDTDPHAHPGATEDCFPGSDDDCDGLPDSHEPACASAAAVEDSTVFGCALGRSPRHGRGTIGLALTLLALGTLARRLGRARSARAQGQRAQARAAPTGPRGTRGAAR